MNIFSAQFLVLKFHFPLKETMVSWRIVGLGYKTENISLEHLSTSDRKEHVNISKDNVRMTQEPA